MEHRFEQATGQLIVRMPREVDHHSSRQLKQETEALMSHYPVRGLVFDFQDTVFMDSSGIGVILGRCRNLRFAGGRTRAIHLNRQIQKIFQISGLHKVIDVEL